MDSRFIAEGGCEIDVVAAANVTADPAGFMKQYARRPVLVRDVVGEHPALAAHREALARDRLLKNLGTSTWSISNIPYADKFIPSRAPKRMLLEDFVRDHVDDSDPEEEDRYIFSEGVKLEADEAPVKIADAFEHLTLFFSDETGRGVFSELMDATGVRDASERPSQKTVQFYLGCAGSGAPNHFHSAAGNLLVYGRKAWYLQPPGAAAYSIIPAREYLRRYAEEADVLGLRCVQEAGDLLYVPSNWGHTTLNLRASVGFAQECNADACS